MHAVPPRIDTGCHHDADAYYALRMPRCRDVKATRAATVPFTPASRFYAAAVPDVVAPFDVAVLRRACYTKIMIRAPKMRRHEILPRRRRRLSPSAACRVLAAA